jgi:ferredoxin
MVRTSGPGKAATQRKRLKLNMVEFKHWITEEIKRFVRKDSGNRLDRLDGSAIYEEPLVGFVAGNDPIFVQLKEVIGGFHLTPHEAVTAVAKERDVAVPSEEETGVISYILPISRATIRENAGMKDRPSERWSHTRLFGEEFNRKLQGHVVSFLEENGYLAVAPEIESGVFQTLIDEKVGWTSNWSQRHVAFASGLGTFGLSDGLITEAGKAHRAGSVIVNRELDSPRSTGEIHRDCPFFRDGSCKVCAKRCPAGAITEEGHDKNVCSVYVFNQIPVIKEDYDIEIYACGLCQTGVPCEKGVPVESRDRNGDWRE